MERFDIRLLIIAAASIGAAVLFSGCSTSKPKKKRPPLPGEEDVSTLGWGRAYPGDPQPGLGGFPQSR